LQQGIFVKGTFWRFSTVCFGLSLLVGCSITPPKPTGQTPEKVAQGFPSHFEVTGKIGVSDGKRGATVNLRWQQQGTKDYTVYLSGPFGGQSAKIERRGSTIHLTHSDGYTNRTENPEAVLQSEYGWTIPISGLHYWLHGKPEPNKAIELIQRDELGRITTLHQLGWKIEYKAYKTVDGFDVPYKITLRYSPVQLQFVLQKWNLGS